MATRGMNQKTGTKKICAGIIITVAITAIASFAIFTMENSLLLMLFTWNIGVIIVTYLVACLVAEQRTTRKMSREYGHGKHVVDFTPRKKGASREVHFTNACYQKMVNCDET